MMMMTWPIIAVGWVVNLFQRGTASVTRINELLTEEPTIDDRDADPGVPTDLKLRGEIEFRNLTFAYPSEAAKPVEVLHNISLKIPAGGSLAIVGPTGSGKSTLVSLIPRLYDAPEGTVLLDGRPLRDYRLETLRRNIGFVPQETFLFSETLRENIAFWSFRGYRRRGLPVPLRQLTSAPSSTNSPRDLRPWSASAASLSPADRSSARR